MEAKQYATQQTIDSWINQIEYICVCVYMHIRQRERETKETEAHRLKTYGRWEKQY